MSDPKTIPVILSMQEIVILPQKAIIAFAASCARRFYPLFELNWPDATY